MLKLYRYKGLVFQFEEGMEPEGAELVKAGEDYSVAEPEPEPKAKPAQDKSKKARNKKG